MKSFKLSRFAGVGAAGAGCKSAGEILSRAQRSRRTGKLWMVVAIILAGSVCAMAQSEPNLETGFKPYGSYHGSDIDSVNIMNGNLTLHIPYPYGYPQRGGKLDNKGYIVMNGKTWTTQTKCLPPSEGGSCATFWTAGNAMLIDSMYGGFASQTLLPAVTRNVATLTTNNTTTATASNYSVRTWDGANHPVVDVSGNGTALETFDASGWRINLVPGTSSTPPQTGVLINRDGTQYAITGFNNDTFGGCNPSPLVTPPNSGGGHPPIIPMPDGDQSYCNQASVIGNITDSNGNVYALPTSASAAGTDTMGRAMSFMGLPPGAVVSTSTDSSGCATSLPFAGANLFSYPGPNGVSNQLKFCYGTLTAQTNFGFSGVAEFSASSGGKGPGGPFITTVILPDGSTWNFTYDSYGNVVSVVLPLGGSISYQYGTVAFPMLGTSAPPMSRTVVQRTITDNHGNSYVWKYQWMTAQSNPTSTNGTYTNIVTDPLGNDTVHVFTNLSGALYETRTKIYQGLYTSGQLLKQVDTAYQVTVGSDQPTALPINIQTTIFPSGKVSLVQKSYDSGITPANGNCSLCSPTASFGKVVTEKEYDWGQGAPGTPLRETDTTYEWQVNSTYLTAHLLDLTASVIVKDGNGNRVAETDYTYDEPTYLTASGVSTQHVTPPGPVRGNLTTVSKWLNTTNSFITSHTNWYDTGEAFQQIDPLGHAATHSYDAAYLGAFSTQTCNSLSQCVSGTYDFTTGLLTSFTNANATAQASGNTPGDPAHTSTYAYDSMSRLTSATAPPDPANGGAQAQTTFTYPNPITLPFTVTRTKSITPGLTDSVTSTYDGLGRVYKTQHPLPNGTAEVDTGYDGLDRTITITNPYFTTSDPTYGVIRSQYDALGQVTQVTKQDGSVSTVDYSAGNCTTSTDEAGKQRKSCSDGLGRLIEVDEPNPNAPATPATGNVTISGCLLSQSGIGATGATFATAQVTISGSDHSITIPGYQSCTPPPRTCTFIPASTLYDSGTVSLTVNGTQYSASFGQNNSPSSAYSVAQALASAMGNDPNVTVLSVTTNSSGTPAAINLQARNAGSAGNNITLATSSTYNSSQFSSQGPSFTASPVIGTLSRGADTNPGVTVYDKGTISLTVVGFTATACYGRSADCAAPPAGCATGDSTAAQVACRLANDPVAGLNRTGSPVSATNSGTTITITDLTPGTVGNGVTVASNSQSTQTQWTFSPPSFSSPGGTLGNAYNASALCNNCYITQYQYDALGNLLRVDQKGSAPSDSTQWRTRLFTYNSLGQLLTANNPESGTISYVYDADGNVLQKTSPAANQPPGSTATQTISFCYDALHRVTGKAYSAQSCPLTTPVVTYTYDGGANGIGHMTSLTDQAGSGSYSFDILGRMSSESRTIAGVSKTVGYTYNLDGSMKALTYPSGRVVTYTPDSAGRLVSASDANGTVYVTGATYGAASSITSFVTGNSITNNFIYNPRLQLCRITALTAGTLPGSCSDSQHVGNVMDKGYNYNFGAGDNGNVMAITNYRDTTRSQAFTYDQLNRLVSGWSAASNGAYSWGENYSIDAWGNLQTAPMAGKAHGGNFQLVGDVHNRATGLSYDAAGNLTSYLSATYVYDTENRISSTAGMTYTYDANGERVLKSIGSTPTKMYWSAGGNVLAEADGAGNLTAEYVYFGAKRAARIDLPANTVHYYLSDHLGSTSIVASATGAVEEESDYYSFGTEVVVTGPGSNHYKFTGKERDAESGFDYFGARYYSNGLGRFVTPDWAAKATAVPYAKFNNPQTLNLYSYVLNKPLTERDIDGHDLTVTGENQKDYIKYAQKASGLTLSADKNGKISITSSPKDISALGKSFTKLISDTDHHVSISAEGATPHVLVGQFDGNGHQTLNFQNINALDGKGGFTGAAAIAHETFEAYASSQGISDFGAAHSFALTYEADERKLEGAPARTNNDTMIKIDDHSHFSLGYAGSSVSGDYHPSTGVVDNVSEQHAPEEHQ